MQLLSFLRSTIADLAAEDTRDDAIVELTTEQAIAITGGMPVPDPAQESDEGNEGDEADEGNEDDEGDENNEGNEGNEPSLFDEGDEGNENVANDEGDEGNEFATTGADEVIEGN